MYAVHGGARLSHCGAGHQGHKVVSHLCDEHCCVEITKTWQ